MHRIVVYDATMPNDVAMQRRGGSGGFLFAMILLALWAQAMLRFWIAAELLLQPGMENQFGALVHWRGIDQFTGWIALMILAASESGDENSGTKGAGQRLLEGVLALGLLSLVVSLLWGETRGKAMIDIGVAALLGIAAALLAWRQMRGLSQVMAGTGTSPENQRRGLNVEQLWRAIAVQWMLLWIAAEITLRLNYRQEGVEAQESARQLLFLLPVTGVMVNILMAVGIKWWGALQIIPTKPRLRAWLVSIVLVNAGAVSIIVSTKWGRAFVIVGAIFMIAGTGLYLLGFPTGAWRQKYDAASKTFLHAGGKIVSLSFVLLALGLGMMAGETFFPNDVPTLYSFAWRHILVSSQFLWLLGIGGIALKRLTPPRIVAGTATVSLTAALLLLLGILATTSIFLTAISDRDMLRGLFVGAALEFGSLVLIAVLFIRVTLGTRKKPACKCARVSQNVLSRSRP